MFNVNNIYLQYFSYGSEHYSVAMIYHGVTSGCNPLYPRIDTLAINCVTFSVYGVLYGFL